MSLIYGEKLIEYAIRVGTDDLRRNTELAEILFFTDKLTGQGKDLSAEGDGSVKEQLPMDYFQRRLSEIPKSTSETGKLDIFVNEIPSMPSIKEYLSNARMRIVHGYPRETQDLPSIAITLGSEEEEEYLGHLKGEWQGSGKRYDIYGSDFQTQYGIHIITPNYDETVIWYFIIKYALLRYRTHIEAYGLRQQKMHWLDAEPAPEYLQAGLFIYQRTCMLSAVKPEDFPVEKVGYDEVEMRNVDAYSDEGDYLGSQYEE